MILPQQPGLLRRLAYGEIIRHKHRNRWSSRYTSYNTNDTTMHNTTTSVYGYSISPIHYDIYEDDPIIEKVNTGLSLNDLIANSTVESCDPQFFCSICHDDTSCNKIRRILTCDHSFHILCIDIWFTTSTTCPVCRLDLSS